MKTIVFDLDGILIFPEPASIVVPGRTRPTFTHQNTAELLVEASRRFHLYLATARSACSVAGLVDQLPDLRIAGFVCEGGCVSRRSLFDAKPELGDQQKATQDPPRAAIIDYLLGQLGNWEIVEGYESIFCCIAPQTVEDFSRKDDHHALLLEAISQHPYLKDWNVHAERRKLFLYSSPPCKLSGLRRLGVHHIDAAAGDDWVYDRSMLESAEYPLTIADVPAQVQDLVKRKGGYVSPASSHAGAVDILQHILQRF